eukprot:m.240322 g.240322  ORF g.240322 m.240322 type:complete len:170 (-) comp18987_c1_seq2:64-573(-)
MHHHVSVLGRSQPRKKKNKKKQERPSVNTIASTPKMASGEWDAVGAGTACATELATGDSGNILGFNYGCSGGADCAAYAQAFADALALGPDATAADTLAAARAGYIRAPASGDPGMLDAVSAVVMSLLSHISAISTATTSAFVGQESNFVTEGNVLAFGYREIAQCIAE